MTPREKEKSKKMLEKFPGSFVWGAGEGGKHLLLLHVIRQETKPSVYSHEQKEQQTNNNTYAVTCVKRSFLQ